MKSMEDTANPEIADQLNVLPTSVAAAPALSDVFDRSFKEFQIRYKNSNNSNLKDLQQMVRFAQLAVDNTPSDISQILARRLYQLGLAFSYLHHRDDGLGTIEASVKYMKQSAEMTPETNRMRAKRCSGLAQALGWLFQRQPRKYNIDESIRYARLAIDATAKDSSFLAVRLANLGVAYRDRYIRINPQEATDLDTSIEFLMQSLNLVPPDHKDRAWTVMTLGSLLGDRFQRDHQIDDLKESIAMSKEALRLTPDDSHEKAERLSNLAIGLQDRYVHVLKSDVHHLLEALPIFEQALFHLHSLPVHRIRAGCKALDAAIELGRWDDGLKYLGVIFDLLPTVVPQSNTYVDFNFSLRQFSGLGSVAGSVALKANLGHIDALLHLERGRGIVLGLKMALRSDETTLKRKEEALWEQYCSCREAIENLSLLSGELRSGNHTRENSTTMLNLREKVLELDMLKKKIRQTPGLEGFQTGPTRSELLELAYDGPIIYFNVTYLGSHAFIITTTGVQALPLEELLLKDMEKYVPSKEIGNQSRRSTKLESTEAHAQNSGQREISLSESMHWLWRVAVRPVLARLGFLRGQKSTRPLPFVWWICGGLMGLLPIHAAGDHRSGSTENTLSCVISSYAPNIKTLQFSRQRPGNTINNSSDEVTIPSSQVCVISVPKPQGYHPIAVDQEIRAIKDQLGENIENMQSKTCTAILNNLKKFPIVHFACHGIVDRQEPGRSCMIVGDSAPEELQVEHIQSVSNKIAQIAYLSACSTAHPGSVYLIDESIHLASTFQMAGFRHVIGTLWGAFDEAAATVAAAFYRHLFSAGATSHLATPLALHQAILEYRESKNRADAIDRWAPFVHFGA